MPNHQALVPITDFHMHVIPRVDDGSSSMEMSMTMLKAAYNQGVRNVFATPHSDAFFDPIWGKSASSPENFLKRNLQTVLAQMLTARLIDRQK